VAHPRGVEIPRDNGEVGVRRELPSGRAACVVYRFNEDLVSQVLGGAEGLSMGVEPGLGLVPEFVGPRGGAGGGAGEVNPEELDVSAVCH
jgi:hypothetical protein